MEFMDGGELYDQKLEKGIIHRERNSRHYKADNRFNIILPLPRNLSFRHKTRESFMFE